jgi:positive regulator of sigma E activity
VQTLIKTLFDIVLIRKGPDAIPHSRLLLSAAVILWLFPLVVAIVIVPTFEGAVVVVTVASWLLSLACYALIVVLARLARSSSSGKLRV